MTYWSSIQFMGRLDESEVTNYVIFLKGCHMRTQLSGDVHGPRHVTRIRMLSHRFRRESWQVVGDLQNKRRIRLKGQEIHLNTQQYSMDELDRR
jgi:hypothetical protein